MTATPGRPAHLAEGRTRVPLVDLRVQHEPLLDEIRTRWARVVAESRFILGDELARFEASFAQFCEVRYCTGVANGTDALELALRAVGVGEGDEVVVPANTFVATPLAVIRAGAVPVIADVDPDSYLVDPQEVKRCLGPRTRAVMPVHLYGQMAPMADIREVVAGHDVAIVEDAAQAHGARQRGRGAGAFGVAAATSFYPGKNLGAFGDAGAVLTNSHDVAAAVRSLRNYGGEQKYEHADIGFNSRLDDLQAVVLDVKLRFLAEWNNQRRVAADRYQGLLSGMDQVRPPCIVPGNEHVWHLYVVRVPDRDRVRTALNRAGIGASVHYPSPVHLQGALRQLGHQPGDFPVAEQASREILSLPLYPGITPTQQEEVVEQLRKAIA